MTKKKVTLNIGQEIEMLNEPTPLVKGDDGPRSMTVGDVIIQRIPIAASRDTDHAERLWDMGHEIHKAGDMITLSELDFELLKNSILAGEMQVWARVNLSRAFKAAKEG